MTTPRDLLIAAYNTSSKNQPGKIVTEATEGLDLVTRVLRGAYAVAARVNPAFFGTDAAVPYLAPGWARPGDAESVFRIEQADGTEVVVVELEDRKNAEPGKPALYRLGKVYRPVGNATDPAQAALTFFYARRPAQPADVDADVDASWEEAYNDLLIYDTAMALARKDGRLDELPSLQADRDRWLALFVEFLEHETANVVTRFAPARYVNTASLIPLMAGGVARAAA